MDNPAGKVTAVRNGASGTHVLVEVDARAVCPRCAQGKGCGAGLFGSRSTARSLEARMMRGQSVAEGDTVSLHLEPRALLQASLIVYGWPLAGAATGALAAYLSSMGDPAAAILALAGLVAGALAVRLRLGGKDCLARYTPVATSKG
ncbi:MAG: SoxR reducing system RseC family protein [Woeseiaceae bacterium]